MSLVILQYIVQSRKKPAQINCGKYAIPQSNLHFGATWLLSYLWSQVVSTCLGKICTRIWIETHKVPSTRVATLTNLTTFGMCYIDGPRWSFRHPHIAPAARIMDEKNRTSDMTVVSLANINQPYTDHTINSRRVLRPSLTIYSSQIWSKKHKKHNAWN